MTVHIAYLAEEQLGGTTGVRVVEPPPQTQQAQRGNFYALVDLQGPQSGIASLTERLLSAMQRTYYSLKGTQSQVLGETVRSALQLLQTEIAQTKSDWRAGIICIGLMNDRLALAGMGDAFAFVTTDGGDVNVYPSERLDEDAQAEIGPFALWPLHRQKLDGSGVILAGGGRWLEMVSPRTLAGATAFVDAETCQEAASGLRDQAGVTDVPGLLLVISADGDEPLRPPRVPPPAIPPPSLGSPKSTRQSSRGLPTALNASPPVTGAALRASARADEATAEVTANALDSPPADAAAEETDATAPGVAAQVAATTAAITAGAMAGLMRTRDLVTNMLPDRTPPAPAGGVSSQAPEVMTQVATAAIIAEEAARPAPFVAPPRATGSRARLFVALAVIILLLVPAVVAGLYWQQGATERANAENLLNLAEAREVSAA